MLQYRITFHRQKQPENQQTLTIPGGTCLHEAVAQASLDMRADCGGAGTCGKCQVIVNGKTILACQTIIESDLDVHIPESSLRVDEQKIVVQTETFPLSLTLSPRGVGTVKHRFGIAVDIGTTTLAAELHDFTGTLPMQTVARANPQRKFGDDVISRIQKIMDGTVTLHAMQQLIVGAINEMITELADKSGITPQDIPIIVASGNTVMQLLLFGIDPSPLGQSPFHSPVETFPPRRGDEIGLTMSADGIIEALPIFGGFVGGDIVAGVLTLPMLQSSDAPQLLLDIGTNGEIVLGHRRKLYTAATAAGPAFEGARIKHGVIAVPGAIERVEIVSDKITVSTIGNRLPIGLCGSGLIDAVAVLLEQGILNPNGRFAEKESFFELVPVAESGIGEAIVLTQRDVREVQLAVGAIRAGITLLVQKNGIMLEDIETFYVSGGFGQSIRLASASQIGLLPPLSPERFRYCGNTSLAGARAILLDSASGEWVHRIIERSCYCELAELPHFQSVFAESMRLGWK